MRRDLAFERTYPHPPERVWLAITDRRALAAWLMENDFEPRVGHRFQFRTHPRPGFDGVIDCEVIEVDEPRRLAYTWRGGRMRRPTTVTWTLEPVSEGTRLRLTHTGFAGAAGIAISFLLGSGWPGLLTRKLARVLTELEGHVSAEGKEATR